MFTNNINQPNDKMLMKRNFLPDFIGISMTKSQFCYATGCTPYKLRCLLMQNAEKYRSLGYHKFDKLLMPIVVSELLADTGLHINVDYYAQYVAGQRGAVSAVVQRETT